MQCCESLHRSMLEFPKYGDELTAYLLCKKPTEECWLRTCKVSTVNNVKKKVEKTFEESNFNNDKEVSWIVWQKQNNNGNRYIKTVVKGTLPDLIKYFTEILDKFLVHAYIKRCQAKRFEEERKEMANIKNANTAQLHIDFAENYSCLSQDEIQSAHWNQKLVSIFSYHLPCSFRILRQPTFMF